MNFFRDENIAKEILSDWLDSPNMYLWTLEEAQRYAFSIFYIPMAE